MRIFSDAGPVKSTPSSSGPDDAAVTEGPAPPKASTPLLNPPPFSSSASPQPGVEVHGRHQTSRRLNAAEGFLVPLATRLRSTSLPGDARESERRAPIAEKQTFRAFA